MTVTLTAEEVNNLESSISAWHNKKLTFIVNKLAQRQATYSMNEMRFSDDAVRLNAEFERENPRPDWKSLV